MIFVTGGSLLETVDRLFEFGLFREIVGIENLVIKPFQLIVIVFLALIMFYIIDRHLIKPLNDTIDYRQNKVDESIESYEEAVEKFEKREEEYSTNIRDARREARKIKEDFLEDVENYRKKVLEEAREEGTKKKQSAEEKINDQMKDTREELKEKSESIAEEMMEILLN